MPQNCGYVHEFYYLIWDFMCHMKNSRKNNFSHQKMQAVFDQVYLTERWGKSGNGSGPGSSCEYAQNAVQFLRQIIPKYAINNIIDVSCGGMSWWPQVLNDFPSIRFTGYDISSVIIEKNRNNFKDKPNWKFGVRNAVTETFEAADLIVCRHTMMHLTLENCVKILSNIKASGSRFYLFTSHPGVTVNTDENQIPLLKDKILPAAEQGFRFRALNLALAPFGIRAIESVREPQNVPEMLGLYPRTDICIISTICGTKFKYLYPAPSEYDCYLFSNNPELKTEAQKKGWIFNLLSLPLTVDDIISSNQAKQTKFLQIVYPKYDKILYIDHKLKIENEQVKTLTQLQVKPILLRLTPRVKTTIWDEFRDAMADERYRRFEVQTREYIKDKIAHGYSENFRICNTALILYNMTLDMNGQIPVFLAQVIDDLRRVGTPECQIIWAMVAQKYANLIQTFEVNSIPIVWEEPKC